MNDYWNDPPEEPEPHQAPPANYDTLEEYKMDLPPAEFPEPAPLCPHGNQWGGCDKCDFEGDLAFDAAREKR